MPANLVSVVNLRQAYQQRLVLEQINFVINAGDCILLRGANGSGKTTLLNTLCGRLPRLDGQIKTQEKFLGWSSYLPNQGFYLELTVRENFQFYAELLGLAQELVDDMFCQLSLTSFDNQIFGQLSTGQRARALLGFCLLRPASIYLFDEPFLGLDDDSVMKTMALVKQLSQAGKAVLIASHGDKVAEINSRQFVLEQGRLLEQ